MKDGTMSLFFICIMCIFTYEDGLSINQEWKHLNGLFSGGGGFCIWCLPITSPSSWPRAWCDNNSRNNQCHKHRGKMEHGLTLSTLYPGRHGQSIMELLPTESVHGLGILRTQPLSYNHSQPSVWTISSVQFSHSVMSNYLWPHGPQHARPPCPSPTPRIYSNSCPLSQWYHPTILSSVIPFSSLLKPFPASGSFPVSQFFSSCGQSIQLQH